MKRTFKPVDLISIAFILLVSAVTLAAIPRVPHWGWLIVRFAALIGSMVAAALYAAAHKTKKSAFYLHAFVPAVIVPVMFDTMGDIIPWIWTRYFDDTLIRIDYGLFGGHHPTVLLERFIHPVLTTVLQFAYISYYPMAVVLGVTLLLKEKQAEFDEAIFGIILCFYLSYIGYLLVPAVGPRFTLAHLQTMDIQAGPVVLAIQKTLNSLENTKADAFPSGHTAVALMTLYYAWKTREKALTALLVPAVLGLIVSTVYLRYHYVIDVLAGILLTALTIYLAPRLYAWTLRITGNPADQFHGPS